MPTGYEIVTPENVSEAIEDAVSGAITFARCIRVPGLLYTTSGATLIRPGLRVNSPANIATVRAVLHNAPVGDSVVIKAYLNDVLQGTMTIAAAGTTDTDTVDVTEAEGDVWTFDCTVGGSATFPGAYLALYLEA